MGPLGMSAKQHREYLKFASQQQREDAKMERDEARKNELHKIKLQESALKANQGIGHKEQLHEVKLKELVSPLGKPPRMNKQKLGIPSTNPMADTGMFKQGQHHLAMGTDTVPAMLTPGEAVIPEPAAQDPKNKKAIKRMVKEGREANRKKLRDGTVNIVKTDSPQPIPTMGTYGGVPQQVQQSVGYSDGVAEVPSLAYYHYDEPGSSYSDGTPMVNQYFLGVDGEGVNSVEDPNVQAKQEVPEVPAQQEPTQMQQPEVPAQQEPTQMQQPEVPQMTVPVEKPAELDASNKPVQPPGTTQVQQVPVPVPTAYKGLEGKPEVNSYQGLPPLPAENKAPESSGYEGLPKDAYKLSEPPKQGAEPRMSSELYNNPSAASNRIRSIEDYIVELGGKHKDEKSFVDSMKNMLTVSGIKEELGLNNRDILRMAVSTFVGSKRYGFQRAFAYAGRQAFEESNKREAQREAQDKAIRSAAVQMRSQDIREARAEANAKALEDRQNRLALAKEDRDWKLEQWKANREDDKFKATALEKVRHEFSELAPYVPKSLKEQQQRIVSETYRNVNDAKGNRDLEYSAWLNGKMRLAQIADKTPKGTTVNTGDREPKTHVMIHTATNTPIEVTRVPVKGGGWNNVDSKGNVIDPSTLIPITGASYVNKTVDEAVKAVVPQFLPNGKPNPTYGQTTAAINTAFATMDTFGMPVAPALKANIASQAVQKLEQANMPITSDNITKAMYAEAIKIDTSSPLLKVTSQETFGNRKYTPATVDQQINIVKQIKDISSRENIKVDDAAKRIESEWEKTNAKTARKVVERAPLNINPAIWWYNLPQAEKDKFIKEK